MHNPEEPTRRRDVVQQAVEIANAALDSANPIVHALTVTVCDVDIPVVVANGEVYVQATLCEFHDALSAAMVELLRHLEIGISEARRGALALACAHPELGVEAMAISHLVRDSGEQR